MKKILSVLLLFIYVFARAQQTTKPLKPSTASPFGYLDVRSFGAVGDSSTDNTAAFRACFAEAARLGTQVMIPSGDFLISDSIIVLNQITIQGAGGNAITNDEGGLTTGFYRKAVTNVYMTGNNKSAFVINPADTNSLSTGGFGITIKDINICYKGTTPTNNAGIRGVDMGAAWLDHVTVAGFYTNLEMQSGAYCSITSCAFYNQVHDNVRIDDSYDEDYGGVMINNCGFFSGNRTPQPYAQLEWNGGGAFRVTNCEFNLSSINSNTGVKYDIVLDNSKYRGGAIPHTQEIFLNNLSLSAADSGAIKADNLNAGQRNINISNIEIYQSPDSLQYPAIVIGTPDVTGTVDQIHIENIGAESYAPGKVGLIIPVISFKRCGVIRLGKVSFTSAFTTNVIYDAASTGQQTLLLPVDGTKIDANGIPQDYLIAAPRSVILQGGGTTGATEILTPASQPGVVVTSINQTLIGSTAVSNFPFGSGYDQLYVRKDSSAKIFTHMENLTTTGWAGIGVQSSSATGFIAALGSAATAYKSIAAGTVGIYSTADLNLLSDGGNINIFDNNGNGLTVASNDLSGFDLQGGTPTAIVDIAGFGGYNTLRIRNSSIPGSHTAAVDGVIYNDNTSHHLMFYDGTAAAWEQLDRQTLDQALSYGSTLTANRTIVNGGFNLAMTGTGKFLIGTSTDNSAGLEQILGTSTQLGLLYDNTHYATFTVGSTGFLTVAPSGSGGTTFFTGSVTPTSNASYSLGSSSNLWLGANTEVDYYGVNVSASTSLNLNSVNGSIFVGTASSAMSWTMVPGITGAVYRLKNRGTASITLTAAGADHFWQTSSTTTITLTANQATELAFDGTYWNVLFIQ